MQMGGKRDIDDINFRVLQDFAVVRGVAGSIFLHPGPGGFLPDVANPLDLRPGFFQTGKMEAGDIATTEHGRV